MAEFSSLPCWQIMKCDQKESCPAGEENDSGLECWEIARHLGDHRTAFDVCRDCIVYMLKKDNSLLSPKEIQNIMVRKGVCTLAPPA